MRLTGIKWLFVLLGLSLGIMAGPTPGIGGASAESNPGRGVELLSRASKSYEAGAYADASEFIESAFKAGLTGELAARAILLRAEINERNGAPAKALQDYSNALWMDSLRPAERKLASEGKERVMASMGLNSAGSSGASAQASGAAPSGSSSSGVSGFFKGVFTGPENTPAPPRPAEEPQQPLKQASMAAEPASPGSSSSGVLGFFSGVFGGSESKPAPPPPAEKAQESSQPAPVQPAPAMAQPQKAPSQAQAKPAKVAHAKPAPAAAQASEQPASALSVASAPGGIMIVFGAASSEASGRATAKNIKAQLSDILINRQLDVTPRANGGFQIQAGPYNAKSSALALCSAIKQRGVPCQVAP